LVIICTFLFGALHILGKGAPEGVEKMEDKEKREEDIDDMIFAEEEWYESEK
jgi:hypothetical protein